MNRPRRLAAGAVLLGLAGAALAQISGPPVARPLYDGVVVVDPYRWLDPPAGLEGGARGVRQTLPVQGGGFSVDTPENPPQAQIDADYSALSLPSGTKTLVVAITPVKAPPVAPGDGVLAGNVYELQVANQRGVAVPVASGSQVTVLFRGPSSLTDAKIELLSNGAWTAIETEPAGVPDMYTALVSEFGEYALVAPPGWLPAGALATPQRATPSPTPTVAAVASGSEPAAPQISATPEPSGPAPTPSSPGSPGGGLPFDRLIALGIGAAVVVAALIVLRRPIRPPPG